MRVKTTLGSLKPNPFKKQIQNGRLDPSIIAQLKESIEKTSFWEGLTVREIDGEYELAYGHHRLEAAIQLYGRKHEISVQVEPYDNIQMMIALADENAGPEESLEAQRDVVVMARDYLRKHAEACREYPLHGGKGIKGGAEKHEHGSLACIVAFLGESNWNTTKVSHLLQIARNLDESILRAVAPPTGSRSGGHGLRSGEISQQSAVALSQVASKPAQRIIAEQVIKAQVGVREVKAIVEEVKTAPPKEQPKVAARVAREVITDKVQVEKKQEAARQQVRAAARRPADLSDLTKEQAQQVKETVHRLKERLEQAQQQPRSSRVLFKNVRVPDAVRREASDIVDAGFHARSIKRHPDRGGKQDEMQITNAARLWLKTLIERG